MRTRDFNPENLRGGRNLFKNSGKPDEEKGNMTQTGIDIFLPYTWMFM